MPYKDTDKQAAYLRAYKAHRKPGNRLKCYVCLSRHDEMMLLNQGTQFNDRLLITDNPELQARLESYAGYGKVIFSWRIDPCRG